MSKCYLPDYHDFQYWASVPWPDASAQTDWIDRIDILESWLRLHVGSRYSHWAWRDGPQFSANLAFRWDRDRCLFVLRWAV